MYQLPSSMILPVITQVFLYASYLISIARLLFWRYNEIRQPTMPRSLLAFPKRHPKLYFWIELSVISAVFATTSTFTVLLFVRGAPYSTILAIWCISTNMLHEVNQPRPKDEKLLLRTFIGLLVLILHGKLVFVHIQMSKHLDWLQFSDLCAQRRCRCYASWKF
jgi:hypothetical protein